MDIYCMDENGSFNYNFKKTNYPISQYIYFMRETGLFELISNRLVNNLVDYVLGVEAGLNSNGRKNRGGHLMEDLVESFIQKAGFVKGVTSFKEMYLTDLESKTGLDLSSLSNDGKTAKRFDYVIITSKCVYACECNFYASGGSKLNETARSYKMLASESKKVNGVTFIWFTDGLGWISARKNLEETFNEMDTIYNIDDLEHGIIETL
jgi:type II restriction enzyme